MTSGETYNENKIINYYRKMLMIRVVEEKIEYSITQ